MNTINATRGKTQIHQKFLSKGELKLVIVSFFSELICFSFLYQSNDTKTSSYTQVDQTTTILRLVPLKPFGMLKLRAKPNLVVLLHILSNRHKQVF